MKTFIILFVVSFIAAKNVPNILEDSKYWMKVGQETLKKRLNTENSQLKAKNIIIYLGGGMGMTTLTASRIYKGQRQGNLGEESSLEFDEFPYTGLAKVYSTDQQVPDAGPTATAIVTGSKTKKGALSMDITCDYKDSQKGSLSTIMEWAQEVGKMTGFVTTTRITNPPLASLYAKLCNGGWECDSSIPLEHRGIYKDATLQFLENGSNFNVVLGGGLSSLGAFDVNETTKSTFPESSDPICHRLDGRNIVEEWLKLDGKRSFVKNKEELFNVDLKNTDHLLGVFKNNHLSYSVAREDNEPSLEELVEKAIQMFDKPESNGFVLLVENGQIDHAHHQNLGRVLLNEVLELEKAVKKGIEMTNEKDTLIIVTGDHSQPMTINGRSDRGTDILGLTDGNNYEVLTWANGPGFYDHRLEGTNSGKSFANTWKAVAERTDRNNLVYRHLSAIPSKISTHSGEDVPVYATGPGSSLVRGVFEQNYIGHVMSYVGCMGPSQNIDDSCEMQKRSGSSIVNQNILLFGLTLVLLFCRF